MRRFSLYCLVILLLVFGIVRQGEVRLIRSYRYGDVGQEGPMNVLDDPEGGEISDHQYFFDERSVELPADLAVDDGVISAGTVVDSHMIFLNTAEGSLGTSYLGVVWEFDGVVLGVMSDFDGSFEVASSTLLGDPDVIYPENTFSGRGLEHRGDGISEEGYTISANAITLGMDTTDDGDPGDWIRVITETPIDAQIDIEPDILKLKRKVNPNKEEEFTVLVDLPEGYDEEDIDISTIYILCYVELHRDIYGDEWEIELPVLSGVIDDHGRLALKVYKSSITDDVYDPFHGKGIAHFYVLGGGLTDGRIFRFVGSDMVDLKTGNKLAPSKQRKVNAKSSTWGSIKAK